MFAGLQLTLESHRPTSRDALGCRCTDEYPRLVNQTRRVGRVDCRHALVVFMRVPRSSPAPLARGREELVVECGHLHVG